MILLEMGNLGEAERAADEMKAEIDGWLRPEARAGLGTTSRATSTLARNDVAQAIEHFEQAVSLLPFQHDVNADEHAMYYSSLAYAYSSVRRSGRGAGVVREHPLADLPEGCDSAKSTRKATSCSERSTSSEA